MKSAHDVRLFDRTEWKEGFPCSFPMCSGRLIKVEDSWDKSDVASEPIPLSAQLFYRRVSGLGEAPRDKVTSLLLSKKIVGVSAEPVGDPERTIIEYLVFADGTKMHFANSRLGACVHKLEEPFHAVPVNPSHEGSDSDREEAGRDTGVIDADTGIVHGGRCVHNGGEAPITFESTGADAVPSLPTAGPVPARDSEITRGT